MGNTIKLCGMQIQPGEKFQGFVTVPGTEYQTPVTVVNGKLPGKTLYFSAGIHGGEYPGVAAIAKAAAALRPEQVSGAVIFLHCVNYSGMTQMTDAVVPEDGQNLNGNFPGDANGSLGQRIAAWLAGEMLPQADFVTDLHSGGAYEPLTPCLFYPVAAGDRVRQIAEGATKVVDIPYCIQSTSSNGHYSWAAKQGIPGMLLERGGNAECPPAQVEAYVRDIHNLLVYFGAIKEELFARKTARQVFEKTTYLGAKESGFWYPAVQVEQRVQKGDLLGEMKDVFGNVREQYFAEHDGIVFYHAGGLIAKGGFTNLVAYGAL